MDCVAFLQWALPRLGFRWRGFRKVRGQVCKRVRRRCRELGLTGFDEYREYLEKHEDEWAALDPLCRVSISRFYRDRGVFDWLSEHARPRSAWSAGCASGEEAYTLTLLFPECAIVATDADPHLLERARRAEFGASSLRELPDRLRGRPLSDARIEWRCEDLRERMPDGPFDLVLCRYLAFTYFADDVQRRVLAGLEERIRPGGLLVTGTHEAPPPGNFARLVPCIYERRSP